MPNPIARCAAVLALGAGAVLAVAPSPADAAQSWRCRATPLSGSVLGQPLPAPVAGDLGAECSSAQVGLPQLALPAPLNGLVSVGALSGVTARSAAGGAAASGITNVAVGAVPVSIPAIPVPDALKAVDVSLPGLPALARVDLSPAIAAIQSLPSRPLVRAQALYSQVTGVCQAGQPAVAGGSKILGAQVLGLDVDPNRAVDASIPLLDTTNLDLAQLDLSLAKVTVLGQVVKVDASALLTALRAKQLPAIQVPAQLAQVKLTPASTKDDAGATLYRALRAQITLGGQSIADLSFARVGLGAGNAPCAGVAGTAGAAASAPAAALECTTRKLTLIDVVPRGRRVKLYGAADKSLAGKTVKIRFEATGKDVARATVGPDGAFATTAPMPARGLRATNRARYVARAGGEKSLNLKLARRMVVGSVKSSGGKVTITGRVVRPLGKPVRPITLKRRVTCKRYETVASFKPSKSGRFSVTVPAPQNQAATVYRLQTLVRKSSSSAKTFPTFTLPRAVDL